MNDHLALAWALRLAGGGLLVAGLFLVGTAWWALGLICLYTCLALAWWARDEAGRGRRLDAEREWFRRWARGERPAPLEPCCPRAARTARAAHDDARCTRDRTDEVFAQIARRLEGEG